MPALLPCPFCGCAKVYFDWYKVPDGGDGCDMSDWDATMEREQARIDQQRTELEETRAKAAESLRIEKAPAFTRDDIEDDRV